MEHILSKKATYSQYRKGRADPGSGVVMCVNLSALNNGDNKPRDIHQTTNALLRKKPEVERGLGETTDIFCMRLLCQDALESYSRPDGHDDATEYACGDEDYAYSREGDDQKQVGSALHVKRWRLVVVRSKVSRPTVYAMADQKGRTPTWSCVGCWVRKRGSRKIACMEQALWFMRLSVYFNRAHTIPCTHSGLAAMHHHSSLALAGITGSVKKKNTSPTQTLITSPLSHVGRDLAPNQSSARIVLHASIKRASWYSSVGGTLALASATVCDTQPLAWSRYLNRRVFRDEQTRGGEGGA